MHWKQSDVHVYNPSIQFRYDDLSLEIVKYSGANANLSYKLCIIYFTNRTWRVSDKEAFVSLKLK